jgi:hypothetical protein
MGSPYTSVYVHVLRPPPSAAAAIASEMIVQRKWAIAKGSIGTSAPNPLTESAHAGSAGPIATPTPESTPAKSERLRSVLQGWAAFDESTEARVRSQNPSGPIRSDDTITATVSAIRSGFVAAISLNDRERMSTPSLERTQLLVEIANAEATDVDAQIEACESASGDEIPTDSAKYERAVRAIESWCAREKASAAAGVGASSVVRRKQITHRIDSAIQTAPPHLRSALSTTAAQARRVATTQQCEAIEQELDSLSHSELPADEWLQAIAALDPLHSTGDHTGPHGDLRIHALLIMRAR